MPTVRLLSYCPAVRRRGRFSWEPKKITDHCPSKRELSDRAGTGYMWGPGCGRGEVEREGLGGAGQTPSSDPLH